MPEPSGKKLVIGKDISADKVLEALNTAPKKDAKEKVPVRKLGAGVTIPPEYIRAEQILLEKLISKNAGKKTKGKGAGMENIVGMHIGQKLVKGQPTGTLAVVVSVLKKIADSKKVHASFRIPKRIKVPTKKGSVYVPVDVKVGSTIMPSAIGGEGCMLDMPNAGRGSIGCFVYKNIDDDHADLLLTNNHVIGRFCNGSPDKRVATTDVVDLDENVIAGDPVICGVLDDTDGFSIDAALAFSGGRNPTEDSNRHVALTYSRTPVRAEINDVVVIYGAETKRKIRGQVRRAPSFATVNYTKSFPHPIGRELKIKGVFIIQPLDGEPHFSQGGDSGSLIVRESDNAPCGLLIGEQENDPDLGAISLAHQLVDIQADLRFTGVHSVT